MSKTKCYQTLLVAQLDFTLHITLNRPKVRNAMSLQMVNELNSVFEDASHDLTIRAIVLRGADGHFCAGGDIKDMANAQLKTGQTSETEDDPFFTLNRAFGHMLTRVNTAPMVVITILEGAVLGGGFGLACVSDIAITAADAQFGLPETGLGVVPAQIAPFVVTRIGLTQARRLALLGERFDGNEAVNLSIAHYACDTPQDIETCLGAVLQKVKRTAPHANQVTKALLHQVEKVEMEHLLDSAAHDFARAVQSEEGTEGTMAFVQKRLPTWAQ
jgi:isohexenylglutaconyl-CoA hydratase